MGKRARQFLLVFALTGMLVADSLAITTAPVEVICPICGTKNSFFDYMSWGSYVYHYKSKYQLVFFPYTWGVSFYICNHCHLATYMWDFKNFPKDKTDEVRKALAGVSVSTDSKDYMKIPVWEKMSIAEKVYEVLGKDDAFWEQFYRVYGYHLENAGKAVEAAQARTKALALVQKAIDAADSAGHRKELLVRAATLRHFLNEDAVALQNFEEASSLKFSDDKLAEEKSKNYDSYLTELIGDYIKGIKAGTIPKDYTSE